MDVGQSALLGQHALVYTVLMYGTRVFHRRVLWLRPLQQPWQMVGLFAAAHAAYVLAGLLAGRGMPGWGVVLAPLLEALLWPVVSWMLLAPQRRSVDGQDKLP
jgi:rod shape-determining protein MreD